MTLKKHVDVDHVVIAKRIEEVNNHVTRVLEKQLARKRHNVSNNEVFKFLVQKILKKK
jgi:D-ribose pyranose/furanose isomerase RbsD